MALTDKLTAIGNAIRAKTGGTEKLTLDAMPTEIESIQTGGVVEALEVTANGTYTAPDGVDGYSPVTVNVPQDGSPPDEAFVITGDCSYRFSNDGWNWFIEEYGDRVTTSKIKNAIYMFYLTSNLETIPFEINFDATKTISTANMFRVCNKLTSIPKINNCKLNNLAYMFYGCSSIRNLPADIADWFDWSYIDNLTSGYGGNQAEIFHDCFSLRSIPMEFLDHGNPNIVASYPYFRNGFNGGYSLDELVGLPIPYISTWTSDVFTNTFYYCCRLKNITFNLNDGQPYVVNWKSQKIDLTTVGYISTTYKMNILNYNSGITADKEVKDDATYQALKDDPDWFTTLAVYSRYNHDSAVATINSLPDTSAYLASAGGTNTIKFRGDSGTKTDGGAINTLTEEEIAVATAKGWTVTLA